MLSFRKLLLAACLVPLPVFADVSLNGVCGDINGINASIWNGISAECGSVWSITNAYPANVVHLWDPTYYNTNAGTVFLPDVWTNALHFTNTTESRFPASTTQNGHTVITFDGAGDVLRTATAYNNPTYSVHMFFMRYGATNTNQQRLWSSTTQDMLFQGLATSAARSWMDGTDGQAWTNFSGLWMVQTLVFDGAGNAASYTNLSRVGAIVASTPSANQGIALGGRFSDGGQSFGFTTGPIVVLRNVTNHVNSLTLTNPILVDIVSNWTAKYVP